MSKTNMSTREIRRALKRSLKEYAKVGGKAMIADFSNEPGKKDDREWFSANPSRSYRIRQPFINELTAEFNNKFTHVIVKQLTPGLRDKVFLNIHTQSGAGFDALPDSDTISMLLWEKVNDGSTVICLDTIAQAAQLIDATGEFVQ
jgi:hypothetical protein